MSSIATNEGVKNIQIVITLESRKPNQYSPALEDWLCAEAADKNTRLVAVWNYPTDHRNMAYDGSIYIKNGIFAIVDPSWPGYNYLHTPMMQHTTQLKRSKDAIEAEYVKPKEEDTDTPMPADRFKDSAYCLPPCKYINVEMKPYMTDEPIISINATPKTVFPVQITKSDGNTYTSAIVDDSVFNKTPIKKKVNEPLSGITTPHMLRLLGTTHETILVDIEVTKKYGTSVITNLTHHEPIM